MRKTGRGELETSAPHQELLTGRDFQLLPEPIRALNERNVLRRLRVGMANDPRFAAMASQVMDVLEPLED
jgi:hypothetical protein